MADSEKKDLEAFLNKVEEIESIVKGLNSTQDEEVKEAVKKADEKISSLRLEAKKVSRADEAPTGFNRSFVNTNINDGPMDSPNIQGGMDQAAFMKAMEVEAMERSERRQKNEKEANEIKLDGNKAFKNGDYETAIDCYSKALKLVPDSHFLYTNRAQARIRMGRLEEALSDCDWALRAFPNCTKAFVHQGKALLALGRYEEARDSYKQGLKTDVKNDKLFKEYLAEVDRCEEASQQEKKAAELFESGDESVKNLSVVLEKLKSPDKLPLFYSGGFRVLTKLLSGVTEKTLFRTHNGLQLHVDHTILNRCLCASPKSLSQEELDLISAAVDLYTQACTENECNQELVLKTDMLSKQLLRFLSVKLKGHGYQLKQSIVSFFHCLSITDVGRQGLATHLDLLSLTNWVLNITKSDVQLAVNGLAILNNLALHNLFKKQLRPVIDEQVLPAFVKLLDESTGSTLAVLPSCINMMLNLSGDPAIRIKMSSNQTLWKSLLSRLKGLQSRENEALPREIIMACLGLLVNMSSEMNTKSKNFALDCCQTCLALSGDKCSPEVNELCLRLTSLCLPHTPEAIHGLTEANLSLLLTALQSEKTSKSALKCWTVCTKTSDITKTFLVSHGGISELVKQLKSSDETVIGNAALCLSHCTEDKSVCDSLTKTNIVQDLLVLTRDGRKSELQNNCGILLAKLATGNNSHLERLRELHGIEILHQVCGKHLK